MTPASTLSQGKEVVFVGVAAPIGNLCDNLECAFAYGAARLANDSFKCLLTSRLLAYKGIVARNLLLILRDATFIISNPENSIDNILLTLLVTGLQYKKCSAVVDDINHDKLSFLPRPASVCIGKSQRSRSSQAVRQEFNHLGHAWSFHR